MMEECSNMILNRITDIKTKMKIMHTLTESLDHLQQQQQQQQHQKQLHHPISYPFPPQTTKSRSEIYLKSLQSPKKCYQSSYPAIYLIKSLNLSQTSKTFTVKAHIMRIILNNPYKFIQYILNYHKVSRLPNPIPNFDHTP